MAGSQYELRDFQLSLFVVCACAKAVTRRFDPRARAACLADVSVAVPKLHSWQIPWGRLKFLGNVKTAQISRESIQNVKRNAFIFVVAFAE